MARRELTTEALTALEADMKAAMEQVAAQHGVNLSFLALWSSVGGTHDICGNVNIDLLPVESKSAEVEYPRSAKHILKEIGCPHLQLYKGQGYWYFSYDTLDAGGVYETDSVVVVQLRHLALDQWVSQGKGFVARMKAEEIEKKGSRK